MTDYGLVKLAILHLGNVPKWIADCVICPVALGGNAKFFGRSFQQRDTRKFHRKTVQQCSRNTLERLKVTHYVYRKNEDVTCFARKELPRYSLELAGLP